MRIDVDAPQHGLFFFGDDACDVVDNADVVVPDDVERDAVLR